MHNLTKFKKAKLLVNQLQDCIIALDKSISSLETYKKFTVVQDALYSLKDAKQILKIHLNTQKDVVEKKGAE